MNGTNFGGLDWTIVIVYLLAIVAAGVLVNRYVNRLSDYLVAGRAARTSLSIATLVGTELGLVTLMYAAMDGFNRGPAVISLAVIGFGAALGVGLTGFVVRRLRRLELLTVPEFYEQRFGRGVRVLGGAICAIAGILNMGLFPKMGAVFVAHATGLAEPGEEAGQVVNAVMTVLILFVVLYTVAGGMVAVILTDFLQFAVLSVGLTIGLVFCLSHESLGWSNIVETYTEHRGAAAFDPVAEGSLGWVLLLFNVCVAVAAMFAWVPGATRALSTDQERTVSRAFAWSSLGYFARFAIPYVFGMAAFTWFVADPDLVGFFYPDGVDGKVDPTAAAAGMPMLLGRILPTGLLGLLVAGLMAAFMSTHDSYFLSWGSVITQDIIAPLRGRPLDDRQRIRITRICVVLVGLFLMVWGLWYPLPKSVWDYMAATGTIYLSGAAAVLVAGLYWKRASRVGAWCALAAGLFGVLTLFPFAEGAKHQISLATYGLAALGMIAGSLLFPDRAPATEGGER